MILTIKQTHLVSGFFSFLAKSMKQVYSNPNDTVTTMQPIISPETRSSQTKQVKSIVNLMVILSQYISKARKLLQQPKTANNMKSKYTNWFLGLHRLKETYKRRHGTTNPALTEPKQIAPIIPINYGLLRPKPTSHNQILGLFVLSPPKPPSERFQPRGPRPPLVPPPVASSRDGTRHRPPLPPSRARTSEDPSRRTLGPFWGVLRWPLPQKDPGAVGQVTAKQVFWGGL